VAGRARPDSAIRRNLQRAENSVLKAFALVALVVGACGLPGGQPAPIGPLTGSYGIHDPSLIQVGTCYYAFGTGDPNVNHGNIRILKSCGSISGPWAFLGTVFDTQPGWIPDAIGSPPGNLWAPDINAVEGRFRLYYAASTFGSNRSVIALATAETIEGPWTDAGEVFRSTRADSYNAIDPDYLEGKLAFGSFWDGIQMIDIDPGTGKRSGSTMYALASRGGGAIEAASLAHHGRFYYLYVSFDRCCAGIRSTYRIMVGRSTTITGPYVDQSGGMLLSGGGTEILATNGDEIGPGGEDVLGDGYLAYHYYDARDNGAPKLGIRSVSYPHDWPVLAN
jgi:arabinan endo-1,5-alpha-L-arabinosidase